MDRFTQIQRFLGGKLPEGERDEFNFWIQSPEGRAFFDQYIDSLWEALPEDSESVWDGEGLYQQLKGQLDLRQQATMETYENKRGTRQRMMWSWRRSVAAVFLAFALGMIWNQWGGGISASDSKEESTHLSFVQKENPPGKKSKITLPDGSVVFLNSASKIEFAENFVSNRLVKLDGEAYFEVKKGAHNPFRVEAGATVTQAIGTSFNIRTFDGQPDAVITLVSGIVKVAETETKTEVTLSPGEAARYVKEAQSLTTYTLDPMESISWVYGVLRFDDAPMTEIIPHLENWYGVYFELSGEAPKEKISGTFQKGETLENVLLSISHTLGFTYKINQKNVQLYFNPVKPAYEKN
ncbi:DUF4974 domain-containing protein [Algoriphagus sp. H41]|uniref:DUF4974 domain-containing protein n=1 Tax=Algoriphagus oliviformis TaxID=2811231 RepID=A0ABS3C8R3_9BACT|nr:FecR domain-containing protein [Algoriphagus oliviformis]MBN7812551.1 DUF4974 domain-containing protein [Algoriphagus oliviformis]